MFPADRQPESSPEREDAVKYAALIASMDVPVPVNRVNMSSSLTEKKNGRIVSNGRTQMGLEESKR